MAKAFEGMGKPFGGLARAAEGMESDVGKAMGGMARGAESALSGIGKGVETAAGGLAKAAGMAATAAAPFAIVGAAAIAAGAVVGVATVKMAGDFEHATLALVHGAGESADNLELVRKGILGLAGDVGEAPGKLAEGMYMVESAGFRGAEGLKVLEASAKGAKIGLADQATVADALTTVLKDYHLSAEDAAGVTGQLLQTVAQGKTHMQDLAQSLGTVLPYAAGLHIPFQQIASAEAVMTAHGVDAARSATALRFGLTALIEPSKPAIGAMTDLGLKHEELAAELARGDFSGVMEKIGGAMVKMGATGSKAFADVQESIKAGDIQGAMQRLEAATDDTSSHEARALGDISKMFGGARGAILALSLLPNLGEFHENMDKIGTSAQGATKYEEDWALVSTGLNQKMDQVKGSLSAVGVTIGTALLPFVKEGVDQFKTWLPSSQDIGKAMNEHVVPALKQAGEFVQNTLLPAIKDALPTIKDLAGKFKDDLGPALENAQHFFKDAGNAIHFLNDKFPGLALGIGLVGAALLLLNANPIFLIITAGLLLITHWDQVKAAATGVAKWVGQKFSDLGTMVHEAIDGVINFIKDHWQEGLVTLLAGPMGLAALEVYKHWDEIKAKIGEFFSWLGSKAHDALEAALDIGRNIIKGIVTAIENGAGAIKDAIGHAIGGVVDFAKGILGITSPSKVFHEIGQNVAEGMANGIAQNATKPAQEAKKAAEATVATARAAVNATAHSFQAGNAQVKQAADAIKGEYVPAIDTLTIRLHNLQASQTEQKADLADIRAEYKDARDELYDKYMPAIAAASDAHKKQLSAAYQEQLALLHEQYMPTIDEASKKLRNQGRDVTILKEQIQQLKDGQKGHTDLLRTETNPVLDQLHVKQLDQHADLQQLETKLKGGVTPALQDMTSNIISGLTPAMDTLKQGVDKATLGVDGLGTAINNLPSEKDIAINIRENVMAPPGAPGGVTDALAAAESYYNSVTGGGTFVGGSQYVQANPGGGYSVVTGASGGQGGSVKSFDMGGLVPGRVGEPQPIIAHGGEVVVNPSELPGPAKPLAELFGGGGNGGDVHNHFHLNGTFLGNDRAMLQQLARLLAPETARYQKGLLNA